MADDVAKRFYTIFQGREDAYGGDSGYAVHEPVTLELIAGHLDGTHEPIGLYPVRFTEPWGEATWEQMANMRVRWGCCDIDTGDWNEAYRLATILRAMGLNPWVERSRSKGWHVWIFIPRSIAAFEMRRALKVAYAAIDLPAKEANPKSELLQPNQLGNYVRLPYPSGLTWTDKEWYHGPKLGQVMLSGWTSDYEGTPITLEGWLFNADIYSDEERVRYWAQKWYEPPRIQVVHDEVRDDELEALVARIPSSLRALYNNGPKGDRSNGLQALAHNLRQQTDMGTSEVFAIIASADRRWGKFHTRNNFEQYIEDIVRRAFQ